MPERFDWLEGKSQKPFSVRPRLSGRPEPRRLRLIPARDVRRRRCPGPLAIGQAVFDRGRVFCSATLVSPDTIVTAAHCLFFNGRQVIKANLAFTPFVGGGETKSSQRYGDYGGRRRCRGMAGLTWRHQAGWGLRKLAPAITTYITQITIADLGADDVARNGWIAAPLSMRAAGSTAS